MRVAVADYELIFRVIQVPGRIWHVTKSSLGIFFLATNPAIQVTQAQPHCSGVEIDEVWWSTHVCVCVCICVCVCVIHFFWVECWRHGHAAAFDKECLRRGSIWRQGCLGGLKTCLQLCIYWHRWRSLILAKACAGSTMSSFWDTFQPVLEFPTSHMHKSVYISVNSIYIFSICFA